VGQYRDVSMVPLEFVGEGQVEPVSREPEIRYLEGGDHRTALIQPIASSALVADSPLGDCQRLDDRSFAEAGLAVEPIERGVQLRARAHSACVTAAIPAEVAAGQVALSMEVRTVSGRAARVCLWQEGPNRCATLAALPASPGWRPYRVEVTLEPGTTSARLYLYADGVDGGTVVEYRDLAARPVAPEIVNIRPAVPSASTPTVQWEQDGGSRFSARVAGGPYPAVVVLDESFGSGWQVDGAEVRGHTEVNGYANAWVLASGGALSIRYGPNAWARAALWVSVAVALLAVGRTVWRRRRSRALPLVEPPSPPPAH